MKPKALDLFCGFGSSQGVYRQYQGKYADRPSEPMQRLFLCKSSVLRLGAFILAESKKEAIELAKEFFGGSNVPWSADEQSELNPNLK